MPSQNRMLSIVGNQQLKKPVKPDPLSLRLVPVNEETAPFRGVYALGLPSIQYYARNWRSAAPSAQSEDLIQDAVVFSLPSVEEAILDQQTLASASDDQDAELREGLAAALSADGIVLTDSLLPGHAAKGVLKKGLKRRSKTLCTSPIVSVPERNKPTYRCFPEEPLFMIPAVDSQILRLYSFAHAAKVRQFEKQMRYVTLRLAELPINKCTSVYELERAISSDKVTNEQSDEDSVANVQSSRPLVEWLLAGTILLRDGKIRPVVSFKSGYPDLKKWFLAKGWLVNPDKDTSTDFNVRFAIKGSDIDRASMQPWQFSNHFPNSSVLTTKGGLLRTIHANDGDIDKRLFLPDAYRVVTTTDSAKLGLLNFYSGNDETTEFIERFLDMQCLKVLRAWSSGVLHELCIDACDNDSALDTFSVQNRDADDSTNALARQSYSKSLCSLCYRHILYKNELKRQTDLDCVSSQRTASPLTQAEIRKVLPTLQSCYYVPDYYAKVEPQDIEEGLRQNGLRSDREHGFHSPLSKSTKSKGSEAVRERRRKKQTDACGAINLAWNEEFERLKQTLNIEDEQSFALAPVVASKGCLQTLSEYTGSPLNVDSRLEQLKMLLEINFHLQVDCQGPIYRTCKGIFIGKPGAKSRGRGIFCSDDIETLLTLSGDDPTTFEVADEAAINTSDKYIIMKYIETPLLLGGFKFDIRQWVFVSSLNPLIIFQWCSPYLRFCSEKYGLDAAKLANPYIHLSNNSVQKYSSTFGGGEGGGSAEQCEFLGQGNMWHWNRFRDYLEDNAAILEARIRSDLMGLSCSRNYRQSKYNPALRFDTIADRLLYDMSRIIITTIQAARLELNVPGDQDNNFELFGYDFMIDDNLDAWLIEINASPTLEHSTKIVTELIDNMCKGVVNIISEARMGTALKTGASEMHPSIKNASSVFSACVQKGSDARDALSDWRLIFREKKRVQAGTVSDMQLSGKSIPMPYWGPLK